MDALRRRYRCVLWSGIAVNGVFVAALCFFPNALLELLAVRLDQPIWARVSGMLLFIISAFYVPAAQDVDRYRANAWLHSLVSRALGAAFFFSAVLLFGFERGYLSIAIVDALFGSLSLAVLLQIQRRECAERRALGG